MVYCEFLVVNSIDSQGNLKGGKDFVFKAYDDYTSIHLDGNSTLEELINDYDLHNPQKILNYIFENSEGLSEMVAIRGEINICDVYYKVDGSAIVDKDGNAIFPDDVIEDDE